MVQTATVLASRAATAIENARLHRTVKDIADALQGGLTPPVPPHVPGLHIATRYLAAGEGVEVGGDFYDVVELDGGRWLITVGDVCGRGSAAAALNAQMRFAARALARSGVDVPELAAELNRNLVADAEDTRFCTAVLAMIKPGPTTTVELVAAGHPAPVVVRRDGRIERETGSNPLLGVMPDAVYTTDSLELGPGDLLVMVTDGVVEARSPTGAIFDDEGLLAAIASAPPTADAVAGAVEAAVDGFTAGHHTDDLAIVVVQAGPLP